MSYRRRSRISDESGFIVIGGVLALVIYIVAFLIFIKYGAAHDHASIHSTAIYGLFQGFFAVPAFLWDVFINSHIAIYQDPNSGHWYDLAYLLGIGAFGGAVLSA